jgi:hypothetical protein
MFQKARPYGVLPSDLEFLKERMTESNNFYFPIKHNHGVAYGVDNTLRRAQYSESTTNSSPPWRLNGVRVSQTTLQPFCHRLQQLIAHHMSL